MNARIVDLENDLPDNAYFNEGGRRRPPSVFDVGGKSPDVIRHHERNA